MNALGYSRDEKVTEVLSSNQFTLSAEIVPPRNGTSPDKIYNQAEVLVEAGAEFLSVTKGAGGSLRGGSLPIAHAIKENLVPSIAHFTCRENSPQEIENTLTNYHIFGIRNILALRGDPPFGQPDWNPNHNAYNYAYQLIEQIKDMNNAEFLERPGGLRVAQTEKTDFCIGAAAHPEHPDADERIDFFKNKVEAGAEFGISQMIFNAEAYARFMDALQSKGVDVPVLPGVRILRTRDSADRMSEMFGISVPKKMYCTLPEKKSPDNIEQSIEAFVNFIEELRKLGAPGIHMFVLADTKLHSRGMSEVLKLIK